MYTASTAPHTLTRACLRPLQVNSVNCNTSWKINLFMMFNDHREEVLKGVSELTGKQHCTQYKCARNADISVLKGSRV